MAVPIAPTAGEPIAEAWGDVVHNTVVATDIQTGYVPISINNSQQGSAVVTFPRPFADNPVIVAMIISAAGGALGLLVQAAAASATQVTLRLSTSATTTISGVGVMWIAIGPRS
jgi:hypothetical protein